MRAAMTERAGSPAELDEWRRLHDEASRTLRRALLAQVGVGLYCLLIAAGPDAPLLLEGGRLRLPVAGTSASYAATLALAAAGVLVVTAYLQVFAGHWLALGAPEGARRLPCLFNLDSRVAAVASNLGLYWVGPASLAVLAWKALPRPAGPAYVALASGAALWLVLLQLRRGAGGGAARVPLAGAAAAAATLLVLSGLALAGAVRLPLSRGVDAAGSDFAGADLRGLRLTNARMSGANLQGADLRGVDLRGADLSGADLGEANLDGADAAGARFRGADLRKATLLGARLRGADFEKAALIKTSFAGSDLDGARFVDADLRHTVFEDVSLRDAEIVGCRVRAIHFVRADLRGARLRDNFHFGQEDLETSCLDETTELPERFHLPANAATSCRALDASGTLVK